MFSVVSGLSRTVAFHIVRGVRLPLDEALGRQPDHDFTSDMVQGFPSPLAGNEGEFRRGPAVARNAEADSPAIVAT